MKSKARDFPRLAYGLMGLAAISLYAGLVAQPGAVQVILLVKSVALLGLALSVLSAPRRIAERLAARRKR